MQSANKNQIARLAALTLIFSYAELLIPRALPFFRLGLGNIALLMGLAAGLTFPTFMLLSVVKTVAANLMAGTLFSPFFLVSFAQSLVSALVMFGLYRVGRPGLRSTDEGLSDASREGIRRRLLSLYGISVCGAASSAVVQIALTSLYLGQGTWSLLGPMLLFNLVSGFITAWKEGEVSPSLALRCSLPLLAGATPATPPATFPSQAQFLAPAIFSALPFSSPRRLPYSS